MQAADALLPRAHVRLRKLDLRVAIGVMLMLVAVLGGTSLIKKAQARTQVLVAARAVQPGDVIGASDLRVVEASLSAGIAFLPATMRTEILGRVAAEPWWEGKLLGPGSLSQSPPLPAGTVAMSLALKPEQSVAGTIRPGDSVAVIASTAPGAGDSRTTILFTSIPVLAVTRADASAGGAVIVTLRLRLEEARALAQARAQGPIDLAMLSGAHS